MACQEFLEYNFRIILKRLASKYWPLVLLLIAIGAILYVSRYAEDRKAEQQKDAQSRSPQATVTPNNAGKSTQEAPKAEHHPDWIDTFVWPEGATVWALFLTLLVIAWQSTEARAATQATEQTVKASHDGARAWIGVRVYQDNTGQGPFDDLIEAPRIYWEIKNSGQTPAFITEVSTHIAVLNSLDGEPEFEWKPLAVYTFIGARIATQHRVHMSHHAFDLCERRQMFLKIYGRIKYRDVFGVDHETGFSFRYRPTPDASDPVEQGFYQETGSKYNYNT